jgi:hypothetical protein
MVGQINNQTPMVRPAQDWRHVCVTFEGKFTINVVNFCSCKQFIKEAYK